MTTVKRTDGPGKVRLENAIKNIKTVVGKVGWSDGKMHPKTDPNEEEKTIAEIAAQNELGDPSQNIPARPFMRPTIARQKNAWKNQSASGARAIMAGNETSYTVIDKISQGAAGDCRETITQIYEPKLTPFTIEKRRDARKLGKSQGTGSLTKPLVDTGYMINSLTSVVEYE